MACLYFCTEANQNKNRRMDISISPICLFYGTVTSVLRWFRILISFEVTIFPWPKTYFKKSFRLHSGSSNSYRLICWLKYNSIHWRKTGKKVLFDLKQLLLSPNLSYFFEKISAPTLVFSNASPVYSGPKSDGQFRKVVLEITSATVISNLNSQSTLQSWRTKNDALRNFYWVNI